MSTVERAGLHIRYHSAGEGHPVVLVMGAGSTGRSWELHQVPALVAAGYRVTVFDNRGTGDTADAGAFTIDDLVDDTAAVVEAVAEGRPALVAGTSLGARIAQELALACPDLLGGIALLAAHGRLDPVQRALSRGEAELIRAGVELPPEYAAAVTALHNLSPATLADPRGAQDWLELFELYPPSRSAGALAQIALCEFADRVPAYRDITVPTLVVGFADDRMIPPFLSREVADAVPGARYHVVPGCGHYGYLERPDLVNALLLEFFDSLRPALASRRG
ncbi:alpha/beta fold hydrolase [Actinoallomurus acaciae]|uniref:Alpha/beta fold hydrolase n=1 Tax=Actinoallomurus acaciae TaxID=502577 RepID=A0ABV5YCA2_9ACTN